MSVEVRHCDNMDPERGLPSLADKSVDHVITDPPYEAEAHTRQRRVKRGGGVMSVEALTFDAITDGGRIEVSREIARVVRRWAVVFCQVEAAVKWACSLEAAGMKYKRTGIWVKPDGMPQYSGDRPGMGYEAMVIAHAGGRSRWNGGGRHGVWTINKNDPSNTANHPTRKPLALMQALVRDFTDPGELILDPYAGSGTTLLAAKRLGRRALGMETNAEYAAIAERRCDTAREQREMFG